MKQLHHFLLLFLMLFVVASCQSELEDDGYGDGYEGGYGGDDDSDVHFSNSSFSFSSSSNSMSVTVFTDLEWSAVVQYSDGSYGSVLYSTEATTETDTEAEEEDYTSGEDEDFLNVETDTGYSEESYFEEDNYVWGPDGNIYNEEDLEEDSWNYNPFAESELNWVSISTIEGDSSDDDITIRISVNENTRTSTRAATLIVTDINGVEYTLPITQEEGEGDILGLTWYSAPNDFEMFDSLETNYSATLSVEGGELSLRIETNTPTEFAIESDEDWIRKYSYEEEEEEEESDTRSTDKIYYEFTFDTNDGYLPRTATITISAQYRTDMEPIVVEFTQSGYEVLDGGDELKYISVDTAGSDFEISFESNMPIEIKEMPSWIELISTRATTTRGYSFTASAYEGESAGRAGAIVFYNSETGAELTYSISQGNAIYHISTDDADNLTQNLYEIFGESYVNSNLMSAIVIAGTLNQAEMLAVGALAQNYLVDIDMSDVEVVGSINLEYGTSVSSIVDGNAIPRAMFSGAKYLERFVLPKGVKDFGQSAFSSCTSLEMDITSIFDNTDYIGTYAFYQCTKITGELSLPETLSELNEYAFYACSSLTGVVKIPSALTWIKDATFAACRSITGVTFHDNITSIGESAFSSCTGLTGTLTIPPLVTSIKDKAFYSCEGIESVVLHSGVTSIGDYSFNGCTKLKSIEFPSAIKSIGEFAFAYCDLSEGTLTVPGSIVDIEDRTFAYSGVKSLVIEEGIESIYASFYGCADLADTVVLPSTMRELKTYSYTINYTSYYFGSFEGCSSLQRVEFNELLETIGRNSFEDCSSLSGHLDLPSRISSISYYAFNGCSSLTGVTIPENVTSIGYYAFCGCTNLGGTISIPESVKTIYPYAFSKCTSIDNFELFWRSADDICSFYITASTTAIPSQFTSTSEDHVIYVPEGCKDVYTSSTWGSFNVVER